MAATSIEKRADAQRMPIRVIVLGVPSAAGAFSSGPTAWPQATRDAGLIAALESRGIEVEDTGDIGPFHLTEDPDHPACRNTAGVLQVTKATMSAMAAAGEGLVLVLGGDCSMVSGVLGGARVRAAGPIALVYLDAHGDLNTPHTSPSGRICGMALAVAVGRGAEELTAAVSDPPLVEAARTVLLGFRELDPGEREMIEPLGLALDAPSIRRDGPEATADRALRIAGEVPIVVHMDLDVIDSADSASEAPEAPRGLPRTDVTAMLRRLLGAPRVMALSVSGLAPDSEPTHHRARALVEMLSSALEPAESSTRKGVADSALG